MIQKVSPRVNAVWQPAPSAPTDRRILLEACQASFSFNGTPVVDKVDLRLEAGRMIGVIGPNGAGKSTLVKLLCRSLTPSDGRIWLNGRNLNQWRLSDLARVLAVVPQLPQLPPVFTAWEIVLMGRTPFLGWMGRESEPDRAAARQAMEETNIRHLADRLICQLSGGEQQRVVIARALAQEPRVLLLDEPTANLDISHQVETLSLIVHRVKERRMAGLAVFHDLNLAAQYCDELVLLRQGRVAARGSADHVLTHSTLRHVYGTEVVVIPHPLNGLPVVLPVCDSLFR
ncbi:MAG: heme ABC transporter ATP-binding protein [Anaerolineales bacterium]